jgi:hypothetical protein
MAELSDAQFDELFDKMEDRDFFKGSSKARVPVMSMYANSIAENFLGEEKPDKLEEMLSICLKCVREGSGGPSTISALRAIAITAISVGDEDGALFNRLKDPVQGCARDPTYASGQAAAIRALSSITYFGGADYQETTKLVDWMREIVVSDGEHIDALDNAEVVAAAIHEWAFLTTLLPVDTGRLSTALEVLGDQLESNAPDVLSAAAEAIAMIYEAGYTLKGPDDEIEVSIEVADVDDKVPPQYRRTNWAHTHHFTNENYHEIRQKMKELSKSPMRHVKKDARKELHATFRDVSHAVEYPWRGPHFSTAMNDENYAFYGHRLRQGNMTIDRWWKFERYAALKRTLQDGIGEHLNHNPAVYNALRNCLEAPSRFKQNSDRGTELLGDAEKNDIHVPEQPHIDASISGGSEEEDEDLNKRMRKSRLR